MIAIWLIIGAILAAVLVPFARRSDDPRLVFSEALAVVVLVYVAFAINSFSGQSILIELVAGMLFLLAAVGGLKLNRYLLTAGWLGHVLWDLVHHIELVDPIVPSWYPPLCMGFDLAVGIYLYCVRDEQVLALPA